MVDFGVHHPPCPVARRRRKTGSLSPPAPVSCDAPGEAGTGEAPTTAARARSMNERLTRAVIPWRFAYVQDYKPAVFGKNPVHPCL